MFWGSIQNLLFICNDVENEYTQKFPSPGTSNIIKLSNLETKCNEHLFTISVKDSAGINDFPFPKT